MNGRGRLGLFRFLNIIINNAIYNMINGNVRAIDRNCRLDLWSKQSNGIRYLEISRINHSGMINIKGTIKLETVYGVRKA